MQKQASKSKQAKASKQTEFRAKREAIFFYTTSASVPGRALPLNMNKGSEMRILCRTTSASLLVFVSKHLHREPTFFPGRRPHFFENSGPQNEGRNTALVLRPENGPNSRHMSKRNLNVLKNHFGPSKRGPENGPNFEAANICKNTRHRGCF